MEVSFCQTLSFNADTFEYDVVSQDNGNATVIKFPIDEKQYSPGDVVVVLQADEIVYEDCVIHEHVCNFDVTRLLTAAKSDGEDWYARAAGVLGSVGQG